jgi:phosphoribosylanthranilate isomerase
VVAGWPERAKRYRPLPLLLDHALPNQPGGTGTPWSWREFDPASRPDYFILAGGLNADNVKDAVDQLRPDAIDVSSGIERTPGIKDPDRMNALMHAIAPFRVSTYRSP